MKKLSTGMVVLILFLIIIVIAAISVFGSYNGIASSRENVDTQRASIEAQLQRRADLIPNLVSSVKGISAHEKGVVDSVTEARARLAGAQSIPEMAQANDALSSALSRLMVVVENYPQIQATPAYTSLMDELAGTENRIAAARVDYNDAVKAYNSRIIRFPAKLVAGMFGFEKADYFEASASAQEVPKVDF